MSQNLHLLLPLLLIPAKLVGVVFRKMRMPAVVGEIVAGLILGPAVIGLLPAETSAGGGYHGFHEFAQVGLCVLLFRIGMETDLKDFLRMWRPSTSVAIAGMGFPFLFGSIIGLSIGWPLMVTLFIGATLTATSIGVTASVLDEVNGHGSAEGRIIMGAAVLDDVFGLLLLAGMVALATPSEASLFEVLGSLAGAVIFIVAGVGLGPWLVKGFIFVSRWAGRQAILLVLAFGYLLLMAWTAHAIGLAMIIGAYAAGLAFGAHPERERLNQDLRPLIELLTPLFFILIGASIDLAGFNPLTSDGRGAWLAFAFLFIAAVAGKLVSPLLLRGSFNRLAIGSGMMPRGEVGFVFAQMGMTLGLFSSSQYSVLTLVLVATTLLGPLLLRLVWNRSDLSGMVVNSPETPTLG